MKKLLTMLLLATSVFGLHAQSFPEITPASDYPIGKVLNEYVAFYYALENAIQEQTQTELPLQKFNDLFSPDARITVDFPLAHDVESKTNPIQYGDMTNVPTYIEELDASRKFSDKGMFFLKDKIDLSNPQEAIKCMDGNTWHVWLKKAFYYSRFGRDSNLSSVIRITFTKIPAVNNYRISEIILVAAMPEDKDGDFIADLGNCDLCNENLKNSSNPVITAHGCESDALYRKHPSSRYGLAISVGNSAVINNEIGEGDISPQDLVIKPGYFNRTGYVVDLSGIYTFSARTSLRLGCMFTRNAMDEEAISKTINDYMAEDTLVGNYNSIKFKKTSKKLYTPYVGLRFGNFYRTKSILSAEALLGLAIPANSSNVFKYDIIAGEDSSGSDLGYSFETAFKASPFPIYGLRLCYELGITKDGLGRLILNASYLTGKYTYKNPDASSGQLENGNQIFLPTGQHILFEGSQIHMWGVSIGFFYNLAVPGISKEQERLHINR